MKIIKFSQPKCIPCEAYQIILNKWIEWEGKGVDIEYVCCESNPEMASEYKIMSVPVTIAIDDEGNEIVGKRRNGVVAIEKLSMYLQP